MAKRTGSRFTATVSAMITAVIVFFAAGYIAYSWKDFVGNARKNAVGLAESAAALLPADRIASLKLGPEDAGTPDYEAIKRGLISFTQKNPAVRFAYLMAQRDGKMVIAVDSEPEDSDEYSPPGQVYYEATETDWKPFREHEPVLTEPMTDRWGTWVSALVPVKNDKTDQVVAVFGIDYPAGKYIGEIIRPVAFVVANAAFLALLLIAFFHLLRKNKEMRALGKQLENSELLFRTVFEQAPVGIAIVTGHRRTAQMNARFVEILGRPREELASLDWREITHPDDLAQDMELFTKLLSGETPGYSMEKRYVRQDGSVIWANMVVTGISVGNSQENSHLCIIQDIHERKLAESALRESERSKSMLLSNLPGMAYGCKYDREWTMHFLSDGCLALTGYSPENLVNNKDLSFNDLIAPEYREALWREWERVLDLQLPFRYEYEIVTACGERKWVLELGQGIYDEQGRVETLEGIVIDITENKRHIEEIRYLSDHDLLTGQFNRRYFNEQKARLNKPEHLPLSIIIADINGVRLVNDALGYSEGDWMIQATAGILHGCCRACDLLARTGGDEFTILMPNTGRDQAIGMIRTIQSAFASFNATIGENSQNINLSIGYGVKLSFDESIEAVELEAEELMHKRKLFESKTFHSAMLSSVMATLYARSQETEEHAQRIADLSRLIGEKMGLSQKSLDDLQLLAMLHDIGKVGIDDRILNKQGRLNEKDWVAMKKHPEIGYRITMSSPELEPISEYILCHHERWDGNGYPRGLKGEEIPLPARILAIADSYDAMTEDRVYRKAMTREAAIAEIMKNAGTQFDPGIARLFVENV